MLAADFQLVRDINAELLPEDTSPESLLAVGSVVYFTSTTGSLGKELWKTDGTLEGTRTVKDIFPGTGSSVPADFTDINGTLYFTANDGATGYELWKSNGTAAGTMPMKDI